jgi:2'-5' RNA ligase
MPVHKKLIENGAIFHFHLTLKFVGEYCESELTLWLSINLLRSLNLAYNI